MSYDEAGTGMDIDQNERTVNEPLMRKVLDHITAHPEEWDQEIWWSTGCGTSGCAAGWTVHFAGYEATTDPDHGWTVVESATGLPLDGLLIDEAAADLLGLNTDQAHDLFDEYNDLRDLYTLASRYTDGAITVPDKLPDGS